MHAISHLLKLQIDHVILDRHGQACLGMPKGALQKLYISKTFGVPNLIFRPLLLGEKGFYEISTHCQYVSLLAGGHFFTKTAHIIFLKFHMKLQ